MSNLSDVPHDVLVVIAKQLKKLEDFVSFRCVSKSLLAAAKDEYFEGIPCRQRTPYLMLPVRDDGNDDVRELYSLVEGESIVASIKAPSLKTKKCFESLGWLLAVGEDGNMSLFDPFSDTTEIPLPHQTTFPRYDELDAPVFIRKMVLSARPSETSDFVLMVIGTGCGDLSFWRLGDKAWNRMKQQKFAFLDVVYHGDGQFYAIGYPGIVWVFDLSGSDNQIKSRIVTHFIPKNMIPNYRRASHNELVAFKSLYILKTDDTLLIITRTFLDLSEDLSEDDSSDIYLSEDGSSHMTDKFQVYEVDIDTSEWKEIYSLGSMAVVLGHNSTIAVDASIFPGGVIKPNHIYFTDDDMDFYYFRTEKGGGLDIGVYNMETGTIEPIHPGVPGEPLLSKISTSLWITPCF